MQTNHDSGVGAVLGGLGGLGIGSLIGRGTGRDVAMVAGALAGAVGGNYAEKKKYDQPVEAQQIIVLFNQLAPRPALQGSIAVKITATQTAFDVTSQAIQLFGGNGVTREYPVEKLLRDARASMIEDACNEMLAIKGGTLISRI